MVLYLLLKDQNQFLLLRRYLLDKSKEIDFNLLAKDIEPLILNEKDKNRVVLFRQFVEDNIS